MAGIYRAYIGVSGASPISDASARETIGGFLKTQAFAGATDGKDARDASAHLAVRTLRPGGKAYAKKRSDGAGEAVPEAPTPAPALALPQQPPVAEAKVPPVDTTPVKRERGFKSSQEADRSIMFGGLDDKD